MKVSNLKICIIQHTELMGGAFRSLLDLAEMLAKEYDVTVCIPEGAEMIAKSLDSHKLKHYSIKSIIPKWLYFSGGSRIISKHSLKLIKSLRKNNINKYVEEIQSLNPDIVFFNSMVSAIAAPFFDCRITKIGFVRETFNRTLFDRIYKKIFDNSLDGMCYIARSELDYLNLSIPCEVIPDCLNPTDDEYCSKEEACQRLNIDSSKFNILYVGGMQLIKGPQVLFRAAKQLTFDYTILYAGGINKSQLNNVNKYRFRRRSYKFLNEFKALYYELKHKGVLKDFGVVSNGMRDLFCACDVVVFPSVFPHQPRPCIEAGSFSKPVILSDYDITKEYFMNNDNALTFKPGNSDELSSRISYLKYHPDIAEKIGRSNYKATNVLHNYCDISEKLLGFVKKVILEKRE